jgi:hypothetical protein
MENVAVLIRIEEDLALCAMPERPMSAKSLKEFMLLEGEEKVTDLWKSPSPMSVKRSPDDSEGEHLSRSMRTTTTDPRTQRFIFANRCFWKSWLLKSQ